MADIQAPFTSEQVRRLNEYQKDGRFHPYTCGTNHYAPESRDLVASEEGLRCPTCGYLQTWAHEPPELYPQDVDGMPGGERTA